MPRSFALALALAGCTTSAAAPPMPTDVCQASTPIATSLVTYFSKEDQPASSTDPRCTRVTTPGGLVCRIAMRGVFHQPVATATRHPAIVFNHGSEHNFIALKKGCDQAAYLAAKGYIVFTPFRRGQGEDDPATGADVLDPGMSSGNYIEDTVDAFEQNPAGHPTTCTTSACYRVQLMREQVDDVVLGYQWLAARPEVNPDAMAISGYSYGGIMTVLANQQDLGHKAVIPMAPGSLSYARREIRELLRDGAAGARKPAYYVVARWDQNNYNIPDLLFAHSRRTGDENDQVCGTPGLTDLAHGEVAQAAIFDWPRDPATIPLNAMGKPDYPLVHSGFARQTALWGPSYVDFLERNSVK